MTEEPFPKVLRRRAMRAMIERALFNAQTGIVLAVSVLLTVFFPSPFDWWQPWFWLAIGAVAWLALFWARYSDPRFGHEIVADLLQRTLNVEALRSQDVRAQVAKALQYRAQIEQAVRQRKDGALRVQLDDTVRQIDDWIESIYRLARRVDTYRSDGVIAQDRKAVPAGIHALQRALQNENSPAVRAQIAATLRDKQTQWQHLEELDDAIDKAGLQLESTLSALGTVYSQVLLMDAKDVDSGRAQRLRQDVSEEVGALSDVLKAMDDVYESTSQRIGG